MADFAPPGTPFRFGFSRAETGEVIVEHEPLFIFTFELVHNLLIGRGSQGHRGQRLRLTARKDGRPVRAGQNSQLATDGTDVLKTAPIGPFFLIENEPSGLFILYLLERGPNGPRR